MLLLPRQRAQMHRQEKQHWFKARRYYVGFWMKQNFRSLHNMQRLDRTTADFLNQMIELEKLRETVRPGFASLLSSKIHKPAAGLANLPSSAPKPLGS